MERKIFAHLQRAQELLQNAAFGGGNDHDPNLNEPIDLTSDHDPIDLTLEDKLDMPKVDLTSKDEPLDSTPEDELDMPKVDLTSEDEPLDSTPEDELDMPNKVMEDEIDKSPSQSPPKRLRRSKGNYNVPMHVDDDTNYLAIAGNMNPHKLYLPQLTVQKSTIEKAGHGVFTTENLQGGVIVAVFTGILAPRKSEKCRTHRIGGSTEGKMCVEGNSRDIAAFMNELPLPKDVEKGRRHNVPEMPHCYLRHVLVSLKPVVDAKVEIPVLISRYAQDHEKYIATEGQELFTEYGTAFERNYDVHSTTVPQELRAEDDEPIQKMFKVFCDTVNTKTIAVGLTYGTVSKYNVEKVPKRVQVEINARNKNAQGKAGSLVPHGKT